MVCQNHVTDIKEFNFFKKTPMLYTSLESPSNSKHFTLIDHYPIPNRFQDIDAQSW